MGALLVASVSSFTSCKDYDDDINDLRSRIDGLNTSLNTTVTNKIATVESSIDLLSKQLAEVKADYAKADEALKTALQTSINAAADKASAAADKATANASDILKLQGEVVNLKTTDANLQAAIDKLEGALKEANATLKTQGETLIGLAAVDQRLETGINEAKAQAANALSEAQKAQEAAATNAANLKSTDATLAALQTTVSDNLTSVNNRISSEIAKLDARIKTNEGNIAKLQEAATKAEANFTTINTKLGELAAKDTEISNAVNEGLTKLAASLGTSVEELKTLINNNKSELISKIGEETAARVEAINALSNRVTANEVAIKNIQEETLPNLIKNLREHLVPEYVEKEVAKQLPAALEVFMNEEVMPYVEDIVATETGKNKSLIDALAAKVKQDSTDLAAFTDAQFLLTAGLLAGKYELDDEASADALAAKELADAIAAADDILQDNIDDVADALDAEKNPDVAGSLAALIAQIKNDADETSIAGKLKALTNGFNATVDETNPASLAGRFKTIEDFFAPAADDAEAADISVANLAAKIAETESFTTAVAKAASDANGEVLGMITAIHLFANQHMANCDEYGKVRKWNGEAEKYEYTYGYDNFDHYLSFVYTIEQGIDYDYCEGEAKTPNWNYPEGLIRQLKGVTAKKDDKVPADYDFSYDKGGFTGSETDYDFVDGRFRTFSDSILVRVSPTNADLRKAEIALLNSKGQNIVDAGLVTIEGVKKYDGMITREDTRAADGNETGLWVIKFNLAYDKIDSLFYQYAYYKGGSIVYAVAVKNAGVTLDEEGEVDTDAQRYVVSEYDLSLDLEKSYNAWNFTVNGTSINKIHNRYIMPEQSANGYTTWTDDPKNFTGSFRYELTWSGTAPCCDEQEGDDDDDDDDDDEVEEIKSTWYEYCSNCYYQDDDDYDCENEDLWSHNIYGGFNTILFKEEFDNTNTDVAEDECRGVNTVDRLWHQRSNTSQARYTSGVDNRHRYEPLGIEFSADQAPEGESGEWAEIEIKFPVSICGEQTRIRGFFVTLDNHFALESDNSEINAWATYKFKNVAKYNYNHAVKETDPEELIDEAIVLQPGNEGKIWIKDAKNLRNGDVIGFRVHAVNLDGTFTDPDGRAFYVRIGKEEKNRKMSFHVTTTKYDKTAWALQDSVAAANNQIIADFNKKQADNKSDDRFFNRDPYSTDQSDAQLYSVVYYWRGENPAIRANSDGTTTEAWYPVANTGRRYYNEKYDYTGALYTKNDGDDTYEENAVSPEDIFDFMYCYDGDATIDAEDPYFNPNNDQTYWSSFTAAGNGMPNKLTLSVKAAIKQYWANRLEDNKTYHLTMEIRRADFMTNSYRVINTYDIDITKVMPTGLPKDFSVKSNQLAGGAWTIYLRPWVQNGVIQEGATTMPTISPNPWKNTWYNDADKWIAGATDKKTAFANGFNSINDKGEVVATTSTGQHKYRWGMDVRPYNLEGMFNGLFVDDDNDGQPEISRNYFFVFTGSGSLAISDTNEEDFLNKDADGITTYNIDYNPYAVNPGNDNSALTHVEGAYRVPAIHWSHIGESKAVKAGYVYRRISGKVDPETKKFIYPVDEQEGYESLKTSISNWDWVIDPIAIMVGDKPLMATYACAMGAGVKFENKAINPETKKAYEFEYNQDVTVDPFQGKFYYTSTKWFKMADKEKEQAYFDTQFEGAFGAAMKLEKADSASLENVLANNVMWIDRTSLKFTTTTDGYNYTHYYFKPVWVDADGNELKESDMAYDWYSYSNNFINRVKSIAMKRMARDTGLPDFKTDVAGEFSFDIYDVWFHKTTVKVPFTIKKPENTTARATR